MAERIIHLVDDEASIRHSVSFLLRTWRYHVITWSSGKSFCAEAHAVPTGVILLDLRMPDMDGLEVQAELAERGITLPVIVLTGHGDIGLAVRAMQAGAVDFIEKPVMQDRLIEALERGFRQLDSETAGLLEATEARTILSRLTAREREVLEDLANGLSNKLIAHHLNVSPKTIEVHRANMMRKLGVRSLADALRVAFAAKSNGR